MTRELIKDGRSVDWGLVVVRCDSFLVYYKPL